MKALKVARSEQGFTLIELMIVVGIIGILVAIAAPNFARYQSKARQSEAKIGLSAIYAAEKSFYSEYSAYHTDLTAIGYEPEGLKRYYWLGFSSMNTTSVQGFTNPAAGVSRYSFPRANVPAAWTQCGGTPGTEAPPAAGGQPNFNASTAAPSGTVYQGNTATDPQAFTAGAEGQVRQNQGCDRWSITEMKVLTNTVVSL